MVVHVKVVLMVSDCKMPTFSLPTLWAAQGSALDWPIPVYPGKRHVLLVKTVKRPINVKLQKHALTTFKNVSSVERVWWGVPIFVKSVQMPVLHISKINLSTAMVVLSTMQLLVKLPCFHSLLKLYLCRSLRVLVSAGTTYQLVLLCWKLAPTSQLS